VELLYLTYQISCEVTNNQPFKKHTNHFMRATDFQSRTVSRQTLHVTV